MLFVPSWLTKTRTRQNQLSLGFRREHCFILGSAGQPLLSKPPLPLLQKLHPIAKLLKKDLG